jgi:hypothetical protein
LKTTVSKIFASHFISLSLVVLSLQKKWSIAAEHQLKQGFAKREIEDFFEEDETFAVSSYRRERHYWIAPPKSLG